MAPDGPLCQVRAPTPGQGGRPRCRGRPGPPPRGRALRHRPGTRRPEVAQSPRRGKPIRYPEPGEAPPPPFLFVARPPQEQGKLRATPGSHRRSRRWSRAASARAPQPLQEPGETRRSEPLSPAAPGLLGPLPCAQAPGAPRRAERGGQGPRAPPAHPTWIRGSTSSSSASEGSIPASSSSSSSESRAGGGRSAGPSERFRLGAASMPGAAGGSWGWRPQVSPEPPGHGRAGELGAARGRGSPGSGGSGRGRPLSAAAVSAARSAPGPPRAAPARPGRRGNRAPSQNLPTSKPVGSEMGEPSPQF